MVPTATLDARECSQHSITLKSLRDLHGPPIDYSGLSAAIVEAARVHEDAVRLGNTTQEATTSDGDVGLAEVM